MDALSQSDLKTVTCGPFSVQIHSQNSNIDTLCRQTYFGKYSSSVPYPTTKVVTITIGFDRPDGRPIFQGRKWIAIKKRGWYITLCEELKSVNDMTELLSSVCILEAILSGGLVLHASASVVCSTAFIFPGHSGAGKTTVVQKLGLDNMIANDQTCILPSQHGWHAYPLAPPYNKTGEVGCLLFLRHGHGLNLKMLGQSESVQLLASNILVPDGQLAGVVTNTLLQTATALTASVPIFEMSFHPDSISMRRLHDKVFGLINKPQF